MKEWLTSLHDFPGVYGGALLTTDGVIVVSTLNHVDEEALAALASGLANQMERGIHKLGMTSYKKLTLRAVFGTLLVLRLPEAMMIVATDRSDAQTGLWDEMARIARELPRISEGTPS